jgi:glutathione synthase/RimK-type ligase-like ATP-grasp enzyme
VRWINHPASVAVAHNKIRTFRALQQGNVPIPDFTEEYDTALQWLKDDHTVMARSTATGHSGAGITVVLPVEQLPRTMFYTKYIRKMKEFRVHVFDGRVILIAEKRRRKDYDKEIDDFVRSYHRGWVFCYDGIVEPTGLHDLAIRAAAALRLDFAAIDIVWNQKSNALYVLEANTAPGLEGTSLQTYVRATAGYIRRTLIGF